MFGVGLLSVLDVLVNPFDVLLHVPFFAELLPTELALKGLESSVYCVDVSFEYFSPSKVLPTITALVKFEFFMNRLDVSLEV